MMVDRLLKSTPDGKLTVFKSWLFGRKKCLAQWTASSHAASFCVSFLAVWEGTPSCCSDHL